MLPDARKPLFRILCQYNSKTNSCVLQQHRNFCKQSLFENHNVKKFAQNINSKIIAIGELFVQQCKAVAAQRLRRSFQIVASYRRMYGDNSLKRVLNELGNSLLKHCQKRNLLFLCGLPLFKWEEERISDKELNSLIDDMAEVQHIEEDFKKPTDDKGYLKSWEKVIDSDHLKVWRKPIQDSYLYEYKVYGTFYDVTPTCFFDIQRDLEYRKEWDPRVIKLEIVDRDEQTGTEIVQWITQFPYPMYSREYLYKRRFQVDREKNTMVICSHVVNHPKCPVDSTHVRVVTYSSTMVIKPHKQFDDDGLDYVMTYTDDPQASYTSFCYSWLAKTGVPRFMDELHSAAKNLENKRQKCVNISKQNNTKNSNNNNSRHFC
ncbi:STARD7 [Mytilus coruscus]|uniref:Phosphatidylcholine transfer protein n=1 Tax=Mytilus coruscus TaxID=42192 RepID=A0A6J8EI03_MYTCO|nr:STARD7 [Mytilus coruscus]